jgi:hypothetical protein
MPAATLARMSRALGPLAVILVLAALPASAVAKTCNVQNDADTYGPTYVTSLTVKGVTCARGKTVVRAFHKCRKANGGLKGHCRRVLGYRCTETRTSIATQFSAKATCRNGTRRVVHTYTQNT